MKLNDSEVMFLLQALFHLKASGGISADLSLSKQLQALYQKALFHVSPSLDSHDALVLSHSEEDLEEDCSWEEEKQSQYYLSTKDLLDLDHVKVEYQDDKRVLKFTPGITSGVDIELDDGYEIFSDVTQIIRKGSSISVDSSSGWVEFTVQKFPKKWTSVMVANQVYKVEVDE